MCALKLLYAVTNFTQSNIFIKCMILCEYEHGEWAVCVCVTRHAHRTHVSAALAKVNARFFTLLYSHFYYTILIISNAIFSVCLFIAIYAVVAGVFVVVFFWCFGASLFSTASVYLHSI